MTTAADFEKETDIDKTFMDQIGSFQENLSEKPYTAFNSGPKAVKDVAFSPDGTIWTVGSDGSIWFCKNDDCHSVDGAAASITCDS